ncbi:dipeptide ABC transporter permease DppB, partial [Salmonella enterica subsp. enterica serovar Weltevreden]|nr:dipeptide ABC transporter permease DppB [Salmonella enterica subsp. enterica serovar Weltevreden]
IPVWDEFVHRFKATLEIGVCAMIIAVAVGIQVGVLASVKRGSIFDQTGGGLALSGCAMPVWGWGLLRILLGAVDWTVSPG